MKGDQGYKFKENADFRREQKFWLTKRDQTALGLEDRGPRGRSEQLVSMGSASLPVRQDLGYRVGGARWTHRQIGPSSGHHRHGDKQTPVSTISESGSLGAK